MLYLTLAIALVSLCIAFLLFKNKKYGNGGVLLALTIVVPLDTYVFLSNKKSSFNGGSFSYLFNQLTSGLNFKAWLLVLVLILWIYAIIQNLMDLRKKSRSKTC